MKVTEDLVFSEKTSPLSFLRGPGIAESMLAIDMYTVHTEALQGLAWLMIK